MPRSLRGRPPKGVAGRPLPERPHLPTKRARNLLIQAGLRHPSTGKPIREDLALRLSSPSACGYILWQLKGHIDIVLTCATVALKDLS